MNPNNRWHKSRDKVIFGVAGGLAELLEVDPTIVRVIWAIFGACYGIGIIAYLLAALIVPEGI